VLHSPLLSGIKVLDPVPERCCRPSCVFRCFDFFQNEEYMKYLSCPVFIIHGQRDDIIPFYHGYRLHKALSKSSLWPAYFPSRSGHNDIVETATRAYFGELSNFLNGLRNGRPPANTSGAASAFLPMLRPTAPRPAPCASVLQAQVLPASPDVSSEASPEADVDTASPFASALCSPQSSSAGVAPPIQRAEALGSALPSGGELLGGLGGFGSAADVDVPHMATGVEVKVGPEDGRYERLRKGDLRVEGGLGSERSLLLGEDEPSS